METLYTDTAIFTAIVGWIIVGLGAALAIFSKHIEDTVTERIGLVLVSISGFATAWRIYHSDEIKEGGMWLALAMAFYVASIFWKHWKCVRGSNADKKGMA